MLALTNIDLLLLLYCSIPPKLSTFDMESVME